VAEILTKAAFARRRGVRANTVSMWIKRGRLTAPALRRDGKINVALADQQLAMTLDVMSAGRGGRAGGNLFIGSQSASPAAAAPVEIVDIDSARQLLKARALSATVDAERNLRKLNLERGRYVLAAQTLEVQAKLVGEFVTGIEQSFDDLGDTGGFTRSQMAVIRKWWREQRAIAADRFGAEAEQHPEFVEDDYSTPAPSPP
jgi:hypothetical protein